MAISIYRRHNAECPFTKRTEMKCSCPIWGLGHVNGKRFRDQSLHTRMIGEANRQIERLMQDPSKINEPKTPVISITKAVEKYLTHCRAENNNADSTMKSYSKTMQHFSEFLCLERIDTVDQITTQSIRDYLATRIDCTTDKTRRKELEHIRFFLWFCVSQEWINANPAAARGEGKKAIKIKVKPGGTFQPLDDEDIDLLLRAADTITNNNPKWIDRARLRARAMILTLCHTGMRISDVASLRRDEVRQSGEIRNHVMIKTKNLLFTHLVANALEALMALPVESEYFFWSGPGESKLSTCTGTMRRTLYSLGKRTGIKVHPHRFRETFALKVMDEAEDIRVLQQLLGHQRITSTEQYLHPSQRQRDHLKATLGKLKFGKVIEIPKRGKKSA